MTADTHAEALYGGDPATFVARRDELVRQLRGAGDRAAAEAVKGLRRPTSAAAALNRIAREDPAAVDAVLQAAEHLTRTQRRALSGLADADVRGAVRAHHAAIAAVMAAAGPQTAAVSDAIQTTLLAAAVDGGVADALRRGVLAATATQDDPSAALLGSAPLAAVDPRPRRGAGRDPQDQRADGPDSTETGAPDDGAVARAAARARAAAAAERQRAVAEVTQAERALTGARAEQVATARRRRAADSAATAALEGVRAAELVVQRVRAELAEAEAMLTREQAQADADRTSLAEATRRDDAATTAVSEGQAALEAAQARLAALPDPDA